MCQMPSTPISPKNTSMMGPKNVATRAVPVRCTAKSEIRITTVMGNT